MISPRIVGGIQVVFCSSEPTSSRVGTSIAMPCPDMPRGAFAAMKVSAMIRAFSMSGSAP